MGTSTGARTMIMGVMMPSIEALSVRSDALSSASLCCDRLLWRCSGAAALLWRCDCVAGACAGALQLHHATCAR
jgi:hypothetical protein